MVIKDRPNIIVSLNHMLNEIATGIRKKFTDFYNRKVIESGLAIKTYNYAFDIGSEGNSTHRRSISKLKQLLVKHIQKVNPFIQFANNEFLSVTTSDTLIFNISKTGKMPGVPAYNKTKFDKYIQSFGAGFTGTLSPEILLGSATFMLAFVAYSEEYGSVYRYTRYLNYLARKHNIPVEVTPKISIDNDVPREYSYKLSVVISFRAWSTAEEQYIERYRKVQNEGIEDDDLFSNRNVWTAGVLPDSPYVIRDPIFKKYHISRFFMNLEASLKVLTTLNRKVDYGHSAFDFRTS